MSAVTAPEVSVSSAAELARGQRSVFVEGFKSVVVAAADADVAAQRVDPAVVVQREASQQEPDLGNLALVGRHQSQRNRPRNSIFKNLDD